MERGPKVKQPVKPAGRPTSRRNDAGESASSPPARATALGASRTTNKQVDDLLILLLDVGQGESTLVIARGGGQPQWTCIIDGGFSTAGRGAMVRYLHALDVTKIDAMICTHFDGDHTKGLTDFLNHHVLANHEAATDDSNSDASDEESGPGAGGQPGAKGLEDAPLSSTGQLDDGWEREVDDDEASRNVQLKVETLYVRNSNPRDFKSETKGKLIKAAEGKCKVSELQKGQVLETRTPLTIRCLYASKEDLPDENAGSITLLLSYGDFTYFTAGDLPSEYEDDLKLDEPLFAFKCGHHGSANSTSKKFLDRHRPKLAFISCGNQSYGHPSYQVIERLLRPNSSIEHVYLTNCIHNRKGVNVEYDASAKLLLKWYHTQIQLAYGVTRGLPSSYDPVKDYLEALDKIDGGDQGQSSRPRATAGNGKRLLMAAKRAAKHHSKKLNDGRATVAGGPHQLGTITVRVAKSRGKDKVNVGYLDEHNKWTWTRHVIPGQAKVVPLTRVAAANAESKDALEGVVKSAIMGPGRDDDDGSADEEHEDGEDEGDDLDPEMWKKLGASPKRRNHLVTASLDDSVSDLDDSVSDLDEALDAGPMTGALPPPSARDPLRTPERRSGPVPIASSPAMFKQQLLHRLNEYHRFDVPTVIGLRPRSKGVAWVPFCCVCRADCDEPLLYIHCDKCVSEMYYHDVCYYKKCKDLKIQPITLRNVEDQGDNLVATKCCPECHHQKDYNATPRKKVDPSLERQCGYCDVVVAKGEGCGEVLTCPKCNHECRYIHLTCYQKNKLGTKEAPQWSCTSCRQW